MASTELFKEISKIDQSSGKTAGLKHVTKEQKKRGAKSSVVKTEEKVVEEKPPKDPVLECKDDKRWNVEYQWEKKVIELKDGVKKEHEVNISNCRNCTIVIGEKVKTLQMASCKNVQVVFEGALAQFEIVDCDRVKVQVKTTCPTFQVDKTDSVVIYLSHASRDASIVTSKISDMNVSFPETDKEDSEWKEVPIPEQFVSQVTADHKVDTKVSELYA